MVWCAAVTAYLGLRGDQAGYAVHPGHPGYHAHARHRGHRHRHHAAHQPGPQLLLQLLLLYLLYLLLLLQLLLLLLVLKHLELGGGVHHGWLARHHPLGHGHGDLDLDLARHLARPRPLARHAVLQGCSCRALGRGRLLGLVLGHARPHLLLRCAVYVMERSISCNLQFVLTSDMSSGGWMILLELPVVAISWGFLFSS